MKTDAQVLRGEVACTTCRKTIPENAARAILYLSPGKHSTACIDCARSEAGLNNELAKMPSAPKLLVLR